MQSLVRTVFSKLRMLDPATEEAKLAAKNDEDTQEPELKMNVQTKETLEVEQEIPEERDSVEQKIGGLEADRNSRPLGPHIQRMECTLYALYMFPCVTLDCYIIDGLPSILELLRVLVNVLDPNDQQHTDSTRLIALRTLNAAFEESGYHIPRYPSLKALIVDHGCKYMFQLARSDNIWVLQAALRAISTMFETMRKHLKLQQELFLAFAIDRLAQPSMLQPSKGQAPTVQGKKSSFTSSPRPGTPSLPGTNVAQEVDAEADKGIAISSRVLVAPARGESRDLLLETLIHISRYTSFMVDLYINYDCDVNCENVFERLIDFLTKVSLRYISLDIHFIKFPSLSILGIMGCYTNRKE